MFYRGNPYVDDHLIREEQLFMIFPLEMLHGAVFMYYFDIYIFKRYALCGIYYSEMAHKKTRQDEYCNKSRYKRNEHFDIIRDGAFACLFIRRAAVFIFTKDTRHLSHLINI